MINKFLLAAVAALLAVVAWQALEDRDRVQDAAGPPVDPATVKEKLADFGEVEEVRYHPESGLYHVRVHGDTVYVTGDATHLVTGDLYDIATRQNLTEQSQAEMRRERLADLDPASAITYAPEGEPAETVWVFTDIDCPYCRQFHQQIAAYNAHGIEVRYLAFPRKGPGSEGWKRTAGVWCADDRRAALTRAKSGGKVEAQECEQSPVREHYDLGREVGLRGTPMIVSEDGRVLGGYLPPDQLASRLKGG